MKQTFASVTLAILALIFKLIVFAIIYLKLEIGAASKKLVPLGGNLNFKILIEEFPLLLPYILSLPSFP